MTMNEYEVEVNRCQGNSASDSRQCMCMDGDRRFFFLCSESIADRRRRHGRKAILSRLSSSSWADRRTATLGTHCMSVGHAGAAGETRSSAGQRRSAGPDRTGRRLAGAGTWWVVSSSSLFRSSWRNDRRTATSRIRLIVTPDVARSLYIFFSRRLFCRRSSSLLPSKIQLSEGTLSTQSNSREPQIIILISFL